MDINNENEHIRKEREIAETVAGCTHPYSYSETHKQIAIFLKKEWKWNDNKVILDVGCSYGDNTMSLMKALCEAKIRNNIRVIGVDQISWRIKDAQERHKCLSRRIIYFENISKQIPLPWIKIQKIQVEFIHAEVLQEDFFKIIKEKPQSFHVVKVTDLNPRASEVFEITNWGKALLKEGGRLFYGSDELDDSVGTMIMEELLKERGLFYGSDEVPLWGPIVLKRGIKGIKVWVHVYEKQQNEIVHIESFPDTSFSCQAFWESP